MYPQSFALSLFLPLIHAVYEPSSNLDASISNDARIIRRDVAIIGGGSSGTHAAIKLKDQGHTVIVIERKDRMGGHTETYIDHSTGRSIDYGVVVFHNEDHVKDYFARFNISMTPEISTLNTGFYDLRTGKVVKMSDAEPDKVAAALEKYARVVSQWPDLDNGMFLPTPVPDDLMMSFGAFAKKYEIEALIPTISRLNTGVGDLLTMPVVENLRVVGLSLLKTLSSGFLTTKNRSNSELYAKAQAELLAQHSLLLRSEVLMAKRSEHEGVRLVVNTPKGKRLVIAKRLLVTIPPQEEFVRSLDLSNQEMHVFSKFINAGYYTSILRNTGIPANLSVYNAEQSAPFNLPGFPNVYSILESGVPGFHTAYYGAPRTRASSPIPDKAVKAALMKSVRQLQSSDPATFSNTKPEIVAYSSHAPFYLQASAKDIQNNFYKRLYDLQGLRSTFWTGAAWRAHDSSSLWRFNDEIVLPLLTKDL
jgi:hypothetical protein